MYEILACNRNLDIKSFLTQILVVTASVCVCVIGNRYLCVVAVCVCLCVYVTGNRYFRILTLGAEPS